MMALEGKISFLGLCNWDEDLFEAMCWPDPFDGDTPILNKQAFLFELIARTAEMEVIYPDPVIMKAMIHMWTITKCPVWNELWSTTTYEYNPIENYNRIEDGTDKDTYAGTDSYSETVTHSGTDTNTTTPESSHYVAAYDSAAAGDDDGLVKSERDEGETVNTTVYGSTNGSSGSNTLGHTITKDHDLDVHGNIGTVTTQQMIKEQREIVTFNFYDVMIRDFIDRFCILVY